MSEKLTAAFDFSKVNTILTRTYPKNKVPGKRREVWRGRPSHNMKAEEPCLRLSIYLPYDVSPLHYSFQ